MRVIQPTIARLLTSAMFVLGASLVLGAQSALLVNQGYTGDVTVTGAITPGQAPVTIYDISYPVRTKLGSSQSVDKNGVFAVGVKPPLILNHQIIAVDASGSTSQIMVVAAPAGGPAGPGS